MGRAPLDIGIIINQHTTLKIISVKRAQISLVPFLLIELICSAMNKEFLETHTILEKVRIAR